MHSIHSYDDRARAPLHGYSGRRRTAHSQREEEVSAQFSKGRRSSGSRRAYKGDTGPEWQPLTLYEPGKRTRRRREDSESDSGVSDHDDSVPSSSGSDTSDSEEEDEKRPTPIQPKPQHGSNRSVLLLVAGIVVVLLLGIGVWYYRSKSPTLSSSETTAPSSDAIDEVSVTITSKTSATLSTSAKPTSSTSQISPSPSASSSSDRASSPPDNPSAESPSYRDKAEAAEAAVAGSDSDSNSESPSYRDKAQAAEAAVANKNSNDSDSEPTPTSSDDSTSNEMPSEWSMITLSGKFASDPVATGSAATVDDDRANADMGKIDVEPNQELLEDRKGKIWVGDTTFYAAGKGGYGSCGTKLYDGQDIFFAAMSVYELMGSASPSPYCYSCISLQSTKNPSKTITAVVADSCPACTLGHVDLEQKAFFALGASTQDGILTVGWSFIDCPDGWSKQDMEKISDSVYEEVES